MVLEAMCAVKAGLDAVTSLLVELPLVVALP